MASKFTQFGYSAFSVISAEISYQTCMKFRLCSMISNGLIFFIRDILCWCGFESHQRRETHPTPLSACSIIDLYDNDTSRR